MWRPEVIAITEIPRPAGYMPLSIAAAELVRTELYPHDRNKAGFDVHDNRFDEILERMQNGRTVAAVDIGGRVVGAGIIKSDIEAGYYISELCVAPDQRRNKVGQKIALMLEEILIEHGITTSQIASREDAVPFWKKLGYKEAPGGEYYKVLSTLTE